MGPNSTSDSLHSRKLVSPAASLDVITYAGLVSVGGYEALCAKLANKKSTRALLVLDTPGGDPHAGFRIARALQHHYEQGFEALVPRFCKSAGTLIVIGATKLYLDDMSELGPLDVQVKRRDELFGQDSVLDTSQALESVGTQAFNWFTSYLVQLVKGGLSTRLSAEIATKLTVGLIKPVAGQIDPFKVAAMQRTTSIAHEYGLRLNQAGKNLTVEGLGILVHGYPAHNFVIDRKEARRCFISVEKPIDELARISQNTDRSPSSHRYDEVPIVELLTHGLKESPYDQHLPGAEATAGGATSPIAAVAGAGPREANCSEGAEAA